MRKIRQEYQLLIWFAFGMMPAAVLMNRLMGSGLVNEQLLYECMQKGWMKASEGGSRAVWRTVLTRMAETALVIGFCRSRFRAAAVRVIPCLWGAATAVILVLLTWNQGVWGLGYFLLLGFPHAVVFAVLWSLLLLRYAYRYDVRKGKFWSIAAVLMSVGILLEIYVNPWFVRFLC